MAKLRTGPIYNQEALDKLTSTVAATNDDEEDDEAVFNEKTAALQKFLQHGMSRFSIDTLEHVLQDLVLSNTGPGETPVTIRSLGELRTVVKMTIMRREAGSMTAGDAKALVYIEKFFFCVYCLSEAKRVFDQIYEDLHYSYYNPNAMSRQPTKVASKKKQAWEKERNSSNKSDKRQKKHGNADDNGSEMEDYSQFGISTLEDMTGSTHHKLRQTVEDMQNVLNRWANLLTDEEPKNESFDPESEQDLLLLHKVSYVQPVLRLVPDMFAKYYKCMELAKQWWVIAHDMYPNLPFLRKASVALDVESVKSPEVELRESSPDEDIAKVNTQIQETKTLIVEAIDTVASVQEEIDALEKREEKFEILTETYEKVGKDIVEKSKERKLLWNERDTMPTNADPKDKEEIEKKIRRFDDSVKLLEFQHALLLQDYVIHLEIRPSIIRFQDDAKMRLQDSQTSVQKFEACLVELEQSKAEFQNSPKETKNKNATSSVPDTSPRSLPNGPRPSSENSGQTGSNAVKSKKPMKKTLSEKHIGEKNSNQGLVASSSRATKKKEEVKEPTGSKTFVKRNRSDSDGNVNVKASLKQNAAPPAHQKEHLEKQTESISKIAKQRKVSEPAQPSQETRRASHDVQSKKSPHKPDENGKATKKTEPTGSVPKPLNSKKKTPMTRKESFPKGSNDKPMFRAKPPISTSLKG